MRFARYFVYIVAVLALANPITAEDWPGFRGVNAAGVSSSTGIPVEFGPEKNVVWVTEVPFGRSSPAIAGNRIYMTAIEDGMLVTMALDRASGKELWRWGIEPAEKAEFHTATDSATPTPATDGENVYAFFHEFGLVSYDATGKERWRTSMGPFRNHYGMAASPVLSGDRLFQLCDQAEDSFLVAVDKNTGKELWRSERPGRFEAYSTPILYPDVESPKALIVSGSRWLDAYDLATGETLWTLPGFGYSPISSPVLQGDTVIVSAIDHAENGWAPFPPIVEKEDDDGDGELSREEVSDMWIGKHWGWLNADGEGNITPEDWAELEREVVTDSWGVYAVDLGSDKPTVLWNYRKNVPYIPSPVLHDGVLYMVKDGMVTSLDAGTGEMVKRDRLAHNTKVYASPVAADGKVYVGTLEGEVSVLEASGEWKVLATNKLADGDEIWASPAIADGRLYVRTKERLYSFGEVAEKEAEPMAASSAEGGR